MGVVITYTLQCDRCGQQKVLTVDEVENHDRLPDNWRRVIVPNPDDQSITVEVTLHPACVRDLDNFRQNLDVTSPRTPGP